MFSHQFNIKQHEISVIDIDVYMRAIYCGLIQRIRIRMSESQPIPLPFQHRIAHVADVFTT